jgi:hypothetical protein
MIQQFDVSPGSFKAIRKKLLVRTLPILFISAIAGVAITASKTNTDEVNIWPYFIPFMCLILGFGFYRGINRQKVLFESYQLTIDDNALVRQQFNTTTISMRISDIEEILKSSNGDFTVKAENSNNNIKIPAQVNNYAQLEEVLGRFKPVTVERSTSFWTKYSGYAGAIISAGLMICIYTANNKTVVGISGVLLTGFMLWSFYKIRTNKNIDSKTKRTSFYILFVLIAIIAIVYSKLTS